MHNKLKSFAWMLILFIELLSPQGSPSWANVPTKHEVQVNGVVIDVKGKEPAVPALLESRVNKGPRKWIVAFTGPIRPEQKATVEKLGCRLGDYLPDFAFLATMDDAAKKAVMQLSYIDGVARFKPAYKLREPLRQRATSPAAGEKIRIHLKLDDSANLPYVLAVVRKMKGEVLDVGHDTLRVVVETTDIPDLAALEEVIWIDEHVPMQLLNDTSRWVIQSYIQNETKVWNKEIYGEGQIVGIGDTGVDYDMPWFRDATGGAIGPNHRKIVGYDATYGDDYDAGYPGHGTHVAGTVGGNRTPIDGQSSANGMAPKSRLFIQDLTPGDGSQVFPPDDLGLMFGTAYSAGSRIHTNSWGSSISTYGPSAASADAFLWNHKDFLALFANGNSGPSDRTVGEPATAKNIISVGATYNGSSAENLPSFSSHGPTPDGRIKPTVTAPGNNIISADSDGVKNSFNSGTVSMSGTSMATPTVAGAAALVRQYFTDGYYPSGIATSSAALIPSAALIKAVLINSAQAMTGTYTGGSIPATGQGWGRINLANSLVFAGDSRKLEVFEESGGLATSQIWSRELFVADGQSLKATLVWTDYPGATGATKALVNDLDLVVTAPDGTVFYGNVFTDGASVTGGAPDRLNVEEQVLVKTPVQGIYKISVTAYNVPYGPQPFALAVTAAAGITSKGTITLDKKFYTSQGSLNIRLADRDIAGQATVTVRVTSDTESAGRSAVLTESTPNSGIFIGKLPLAPSGADPSDGTLRVRNGDTITAIYGDANDGSGKAVTTTTVAMVDDVPPAISALTVNGITDTTATVSWNTDEPSDTVLYYGDTAAMGGVVTYHRLTAQHSASIAALNEGATIYISASSTDEAGNTTRSPATFVTLNLPPYLTASSSEGDTTSHSTTIVSGVCTDRSGVASLTVNGTAVVPRSSDGYYSVPVELQVGSNIINITATDSRGNKGFATITVTRLPPSDLFMQSAAGPLSAVQDGNVVLTDTVCNSGPGAATSFRVGFYLSADQTLSSDDTLIGSRIVASLAAAGCSSGTTQGTIPSVAGGTYYLIGNADYTNSQTETNKDNNSFLGNPITLPNFVLAPPASISVPPTNSTGSVTVSWGGTNVGGVTYVLEYSKDGGVFTSAYSGTYAYATIAIPVDGTYTFRVKATKAGYTDSDYSVTGSCTVTLACAPPASISVPATNNTGSVTVSWGDTNVSGATWVLEYSKDGSAFTRAYSGIYTYATVAVAGNGTYTFRVKATKAGYADSDYSMTGSCTVTLACVPPASINVPAANSTGSVTVSWGGTNVSGATYVLEYSKNGGAFIRAYRGIYAYATIAVAGNGTYTFRVKATKAGYADSDYSVTASCTVTLVCAPPASINVPASASTGSVAVTWSGTNVSGATYVLEYSKDGGAFTRAYSGIYAYATIVVSVSGTYTFRVKAIKPGYADSDYSVTGSCTVTIVPCAPPASINVPATNSTGSVTVSWGGTNVSGATYVLEYSRDGGTFTKAYSGIYAYATIAVPVDGTYTFRVKATKAGYADSDYSVTGSCTVTLACAPPSSISVPATNSTGSVTVSWGGTNVSGATYVLEYSKNGGTFTQAYSGIYAYATIAVPADGTYTFRVKATKAGYADSDYSVTGSCTVTLACAPPSSISVPATNSTGSVTVNWGGTNVSGATYVLEYSKDGGAYTRAYSGIYAYATVAVPVNGTYTFRVKATRPGYADSDWTFSSSVIVSRN